MARKARWGEAHAWAQAAVHYTGDDCLLWPFGKTNGYGALGANGAKAQAHRFVCELAHGKPPRDGLDCAHSCGNRACCNPRHLRWASRAENEADKKAHGTSNSGERHGLSKLTEADVRSIRSLAGSMTQRAIAARYGVGSDQISRIINGKRWILEGERA